MPSESATSFWVCSFFPASPKRSCIINLSRSSRSSTAFLSKLHSDSCSILSATLFGSLPKTSESKSSFPSQSTLRGSSIEVSFFIWLFFRRYIKISFSMHLEAYVASFMFFSGQNVFTAFMSPIVPIDIKSSTHIPDD